MKYERFENLPVWNSAVELAHRIYGLTRERFFAQPGDSAPSCAAPRCRCRTTSQRDSSAAALIKTARPREPHPPRRFRSALGGGRMRRGHGGQGGDPFTLSSVEGPIPKGSPLQSPPDSLRPTTRLSRSFAFEAGSIQGSQESEDRHAPLSHHQKRGARSSVRGARDDGCSDSLRGIGRGDAMDAVFPDSRALVRGQAPMMRCAHFGCPVPSGSSATALIETDCHREPHP